jgi:hypothetical protein
MLHNASRFDRNQDELRQHKRLECELNRLILLHGHKAVYADAHPKAAIPLSTRSSLRV